MLFPKEAKICFIGSHPDDIELGCGAIINKIKRKHDIIYLTLSNNEKNPKHTNLLEEYHKSWDVMEIPKEKIILGPFETRNFPAHRQEICDFLFKFNQEFKPDIIFTHHIKDIHQDHEITAKEVLRIFRNKTIIGFEVLRSNFTFSPNIFIEVKEEDINKKIQCLMQYETFRDRDYFNPELIKSINKRYGAFIEKPFAEAFEVIRIVQKD